MSAIYPTGGPWQIAHDYSLDGLTKIIGNVDGEIHSDGSTTHTYDFVCSTIDDEDDSQSLSVAVANARFIVRAANSHAALVEALEGILGDIGHEGADGYYDGLIHSIDVERARAALLKATQGEMEG